jgi:hypothetical protein
MITNWMFAFITRLIFSRWAREYAEHSSPCEDSVWADLGPLRLAFNSCFVLDHEDARVSVHLPLPGGRLVMDYTVCRGEEQVRPAGWTVRWERRRGGAVEQGGGGAGQH